MEKYLLKTIWQLHIGEAVSGIGFVLYVAGTALGIPDAVMALELVLFSLAAAWTFFSMVRYPGEKADISYNLFWGQGALTILLVACAVLTIRGLIMA